MQPKNQLTVNGQEVQQNDINAIAAAASAGDDQALLELLRPAPFVSGAPTKIVIPFGHSGDNVTATVVPGTGAVLIEPFKVVIGTRDIYTNIGTKNWSDVRTQYFVGNQALPFTQSISSLSGSNSARWDLIYASVTIDAQAAGITRFLKDPTTKNITNPTVVTQVNTAVTIGYLAGNAGITPVLPTLPADGAGVYNVPLAYVAVQAPFTTNSTSVLSTSIMDAAPTPFIYRHLGLSAARPASALWSGSGENSSTNPGGPTSSALTSAAITAWAYNGNVSPPARPAFFMPESMSGMEVLWFYINTNSSVGTTQGSFTVVDDTRNWKNRAFLCFAGTTGEAIANETSAWAASVTPYVPAWVNTTTVFQPSNTTSSMGQSFLNDGSGITVLPLTNLPNSGVVCKVSADSGTHSMYLYVDFTNNNKLSVAYDAGTSANFFFWVFSTPCYPNK
jgi:hypothetical protein